MSLDARKDGKPDYPTCKPISHEFHAGRTARPAPRVATPAFRRCGRCRVPAPPKIKYAVPSFLQVGGRRQLYRVVNDIHDLYAYRFVVE